MKNIIHNFKSRYRSPGGYRELFIIAFPLIISTGSWSLLHFIDRMFLTWYSGEAIAAVMPAGTLNFTLISFFMGTASYVNSFIAQYYGAKREKQIGTAIWQSLYVCLIGGILIYFLSFLSGYIFDIVAHPEGVREYEIIYFRILCYGAFPVLASSALSGFYAGRGKSWPVMWINLSGTGMNIILDYFMIFGYKNIIPQMGVRGAAIATVISGFFIFFIYILLIFNKTNNMKFNVLKSWKFNFKIFSRMLRFGAPNGVQFFLDMAGISVFMLLIGGMGKISLAASSIALNINTIAFMPMIGFGIAVSVLVGQYLGADNPELAEKSAFSGFHVTIIYLTIIGALYFFLPEIFILPFEKGVKYEDFDKIKEVLIIILKFIAVYSIADGFNLVFGFAIKGAGDTKFPMIVMGLASIFILIIPSYLILNVFKLSIYYAWAVATLYIAFVSITFFLRFLNGNWKRMRVIEVPVIIPPVFPENPMSDIEPFVIKK